MRAFIVGLLFVACSSSEGEPSRPEDGGAESSMGGTSSGGGAGVAGSGGQLVTCTPGQETACYGDGLCLGSHVCGPDGTAYGPCTCADASTGGVGTGATGGIIGSGGVDAGQDAEVEAAVDAAVDADAAPCPEPCSASVNFPWLVKSGQPNAQGYAKATAACPAGSVFDVNMTDASSLYCWGCGLATPTKTTTGAYQCSSNKDAPLGSCEIHFRCNASSWCTPLASPCA